ncbi:MAG: glycosyltransferase [Cyanobacteria bacterium P01_F01_bin.150]
MKIAYIVSDFGLVSETFVQDLVTGLSNSSQTVTVICNQSSTSKHHSCTVKPASFMGLDSLGDRIGLRVDRLFEHKGPYRTYQRHLKHAHCQLLPVLKQVQPDVAYIDYGTVAALARLPLQSLNIPFVVHFHGADVTSNLNNPAYRQELQKVFHKASALIVASDHVRRLLVLEGASPEKIHVVRLGINLEGISPMPWEQRKQFPPSIVFLGRFTPKKHPVALIEAFALVKKNVPEAQLSMIGDGSEMARVKQRIEKYGLDESVKLYGALPRAEALAIANQHWIFAQHSVTAATGDQEGFGISLAEAAALGLPIVSTLHNGIPEQVIHTKTGFLAREFDYEMMTEYLVKLLVSPDKAQKMGTLGCRNIGDICKVQERIFKVLNIMYQALILT